MIMACLCAICTIQAQEVSGIFDLNGRSLDSGRLAKPIYNVHAEGRVVVTIMVNPAGQVISTSINKRTNTVNPDLRKAAEDAARESRFNTISGKNNQTGTITYYFRLSHSVRSKPYVDSHLESLIKKYIMTNFKKTLKEDNKVTEFMGIPVDGSKNEIKDKLINKGFVYNELKDIFEGEFNGEQVFVFIQTYKDKVWRIIVFDKEETQNKTDIIIRYNKLINQFSINEKYIQPINKNKPIPEGEPLGYKILTGKFYNAKFFQKPERDMSNRLVWFTINYDSGYKIAIFYENLNNRANGEDL